MTHTEFDFDLLGLPSAGRQWKTVIQAAMLSDVTHGQIDALQLGCSDAQFVGKITYELNSWVMQAHIKLSVPRCCDRCLCDFDWQIDQDLHRAFTIKPQQQGDEDTDDVEVLASPGRLNLIDLLREEVWLGWRPILVCDEHCKGICPDCGVNLNKESCRCDDGGDDHPFAALRTLKLSD